VEIIADNVQFLGGRQDGDGGQAQPQYVPASAQASDADFGSGGADDDIPF
jgi:single-stranded DNA-binding protein